jgi:succinate-acetate transporter protein
MSQPSKVDTVLANPAPLGLLGFGMTTILLNLVNSGAYALDTTILAMGIFYGGIAQIIAGAMEFRKGNTFGTTAFLSYGLFWESFVFILLLPKLTGMPGPSDASLAAYLFFWGLFTFAMFLGTLRLNGALMAVFGTLWVLFFLLAAGNYTGNANILHVAGYEGVLCGLTAFYAAVAQVLNEVYGRVVLPIWPVKPKV